MPVRSGPEVSRPAPLRPVSFLAMDPGPSRAREILSGGSRITKLDQPNNLMPQKQVSSIPSPRSKAEDEVESRLPIPKQRTASSPRKSRSIVGGQSRRFSLSSTFRKSRMDVLRSAVMPHPPLPTGYSAGTSTFYDGGLAEDDIIEPSTNYGDQGGVSDAERAVNAEDAGNRERNLTDTSSYVVDMPEMNVFPSSFAEKEARRENPRNTFQTPKEPSSGSDTRHDTPSKRRSRRFSFSRRALKGQSLPTGRPGDATPGLPGAAANVTRGWEGLNTVFKGLHSSKAKKEYLRMMQLQRPGSSMGCAEYDPNLVIDDMSFAQTPDVASSTLTSTDHSTWTSPDSPSAPIHGVQMDSFAESANGDPTTGSPFSLDDGADAERDRLDMEEEQGFLRALGLEFDAIARRVEEQV